MTLTRIAILSLLLALLTGCSGIAASPTATIPPTPAVTDTRAPSLTPFPTATPVPSQTPLPTATASPTLTPTITPDPALAQAKLLGVSWQANYDLLLSIQFPGPVDAESYRVTVDEKDYTCQVLPQQPDRLFCWGQGTRVLRQVMVKIYQQDSDQPGFEGKIYIPYFNK